MLVTACIDTRGGDSMTGVLRRSQNFVPSWSGKLRQQRQPTISAVFFGKTLGIVHEEERHGDSNG